MEDVMAKDIFELLKRDHEKVKGLFKQITRKKQQPETVFPLIQQELDFHFHGEETLFYPYLKEQTQTRDITMESLEEHNVTKKELSELRGLSASDEWFAPKLKVLEELVRHHIEEEEGNLFKKAKKVIGKQQAEEMAARFEQEKNQAMGRAASQKG
jgi:hemerythrin-like domain-containing protein